MTMPVVSQMDDGTRKNLIPAQAGIRPILVYRKYPAWADPGLRRDDGEG